MEPFLPPEDDVGDGLLDEGSNSRFEFSTSMSSVDLESLILVSVAAFFRIAIPFEVEDEDGEFWLRLTLSRSLWPALLCWLLDEDSLYSTPSWMAVRVVFRPVDDLGGDLATDGRFPVDWLTRGRDVMMRPRVLPLFCSCWM